MKSVPFKSGYERTDRVAEQMRRELSDIFKREVNDPRLNECVVSRVRMSSDLRVAQVSLSIFNLDETEVRKALKSATGFIRKEVSGRMSLRNSPELRFEFDKSAKTLIEMTQLLRTVDKGSDDDEASDG